MDDGTSARSEQDLMVRAEASAHAKRPGRLRSLMSLATGIRHLMPVGQSGRTRPGEDRCVHSLATQRPHFVGRATIPVRDFWGSATLPTGLGCAGLF